MASPLTLPKGFILDKAQAQPQDLPEGFVVDSQESPSAPSAPTTPERDRNLLGLGAQEFTEGAFVSLPGFIAGAPGSLGNTVLEAFGAKPRFSGISDVQGKLRDIKDTSAASFGNITRPLDQPRLTAEDVTRFEPDPNSLLERGVATGAKFAGESLLPIAGQLSKAKTAAPALSNTLGSIIDNIFVDPFRRNAARAAVTELAAAGGAGVGSEAIGDLLEPVLGRQGAETVGALVGGVGAPSAVLKPAGAVRRVGAGVANDVAELLLKEAPFPNAAASNAERDLGRVFLQNETQVNEALADVDTLDQLAQSLGIQRQAQPTVGQVLDDPEFLTLERDAARIPSRDPAIRTQTASNEALIQDVTRELGDEFRVPGTDVAEFGRRTQDALSPRVRQQQADIQSRTSQAQEALEGQIESATGDFIPVEQGGKVAREEVLLPAEEAARAKVSEAFKPLDEVGSQVTGKPEQFREVLEGQVAKGKESITPGEVAKDLSASEAELAAITKEGATPQTREVSISAIQEGRSRLLAAQRSLATGKETGRSVSDLGSKIGALGEDFDVAVDQAIKQFPDLKASVEKGRALRAENEIIFGRGGIGKVLKQERGGQFFASDEKVIPKLLTGNADEVDTFLKILDNPEFGSQKVDVRKGLSDLYRKQVLNADGKPKVEAHRRFIQTYDRAIDSLYGSEATGLKRLGALTKNADEAARQTQVDLKRFNKTLEARLSGENVDSLFPEKIFEKLTDGKPSTVLPIVREYKSITQNRHPELWKEFQSLRRDELINNLKSRKGAAEAGAQEPRIDYAKIDDVLGDTFKREELSLIFGDDMVSALDDFSKGLKVFRREFTPVKEETAAKFSTRLTNILRVHFAPLSAGGRAVTAIKGELGLAGNRAATKLLEDPRKIRAVAQMLKKQDLRDSKAALTLVGELGFIEDLISPDEPEKE